MLKGGLVLALVAACSTVAAQSVKGFNYGATFTNGQAKQQSDFETEFKQAQSLTGTSGFASARLYTTIQAGTTNTATSAIPAAIATKTSLLLGLWASGGQDAFNNELAALTAAINQYGTSFTNLIIGISVGSEDLYRVSSIGILNKSGIGADPSVIVNYINQLRQTLSSTAASKAPVGHVDTWNDWTNSSNAAVINACDWIGMDAYPYFESTLANSIDDDHTRFFNALAATRGAAGSKPVWVTETGWPVSGPVSNLAQPSVQNAARYWKDVGCELFGQVNTWWFTLRDADPDTPAPSFGILASVSASAPLYDLSCPAAGTGGSGSSSPASPTPSSGSSNSNSNAASKSSAAASATGTGSSTGTSRPSTTGTATGTASTSQAAIAGEQPSGSSRPGPVAQFVIGTLQMVAFFLL